jgi:iron-sulfur cluster repair protein YtfE (RIC family)
MLKSTSKSTLQFIEIPAHLLSGTPKEIVDYLYDAHRRYENQTIPRIEQQFVGLMKLYPHAPELQAIFNLFQKFQLEMQWHMKHEEQVLYPEFLSGTIQENAHHISHEDQEPFLFEIIQLLKKARYAKNPFCRVLIGSLERFEEELRLHAWIEEHLLVRDI